MGNKLIHATAYMYIVLTKVLIVMHWPVLTVSSSKVIQHWDKCVLDVVRFVKKCPIMQCVLY